MAPPIRRNPTKADALKSTSWQISVLNTIKAGVPGIKLAAGVALFDLVNREAVRAHRMSFVGGGKGTRMPVSGSFKRSRYGHFQTTKPVSFHDFDGVFMEFKRSSAIVYEKFEIEIREGASPTSAILAELEISGRGLGIPDWKGKQYGITEIHFSDGNPVGVPEFSPKLPPIPLPPIEEHLKSHGRPIKLTDVLFDFDSAVLKQDYAAPYVGWLHTVGERFDDLRSKEPPGSANWHKRVELTGHTDSIGSDDYNRKLSHRRAEAVAKWFVDHRYLAADEIRTLGQGEDHPRAANEMPGGQDNPHGRQLNRWVSIWLMH